MKIFKLFAAAIFIIAAFVSIEAYADDYKVMIGAERETVMRQEGLKLLVLDADYFSAEDIAQLKSKNKAVFSYINIGALEDFRDDFDKYKHLALGAYENWDGEYWADVSSKAWIKRCINVAKKLSKKGIDGFFADNADVYFHYKKPSVYKGLVKILQGIKALDKPVIINGGDVFVSELINNNESKLIYGINQESVFSAIDFETGSFYTAKLKHRKYFQEYLKICSKSGLEIYLLEYTSDPKLKALISKYCLRNDFGFFISERLELDK